MKDTSIGAQPIDDLTQDEVVLYSLIGVVRFNAAAVADALRNDRISRLGLMSLAKMIDGTHPLGLRLVLQGQGKGTQSTLDHAKRYARIMAVGEYVGAQLDNGSSVEEAVIDAAEQFNISEPTVYRDLRLYGIARSDPA